MKIKYLSIILTCSVLLSCTENEASKTEDISITETQSETRVEEESNFAVTKNFAVIWTWKTYDVDLINANVVDQAKQLTDYWNFGKVENAYFNSQPQDTDEMNYPAISFFVKATSYKEATALMDEMIFVQKGISKYSIYPVGTKLYGRNEKTAKNMDGKHTWVAVWGTEDNNSLSEKEKEAITILQSQIIQAQYEKGIVENIYFNIEGVKESNSTADFVMFVNAETEEEAISIMNELPFAKNKMAIYQLFDVGVFWMGEHK